MLKRIVQNKYKLMAFTIGLYLLADVWIHKGQARVLFPKGLPPYTVNASAPVRIDLAQHGKSWIKAVNSIEQLEQLPHSVPGFESDVYYDSASRDFKVEHDPGNATGTRLSALLERYKLLGSGAGIWLDIKNLELANANMILAELIALRSRYQLQNKLIVESSNPQLLSPFTDSGFYTSYYLPMFNPYRLQDDEIKQWADRTAASLNNSRVSAVSGYYFQAGFVKQYFPGYPFLTWAETNSFSLVNLIFRNKLGNNEAIKVVLYP